MSDFNLKEHLDLQRRHALVNEKLRVAVEALKEEREATSRIINDLKDRLKCYRDLDKIKGGSDE